MQGRGAIVTCRKLVTVVQEMVQDVFRCDCGRV